MTTLLLFGLTLLPLAPPSTAPTQGTAPLRLGAQMPKTSATGENGTQPNRAHGQKGAQTPNTTAAGRKAAQSSTRSLRPTPHLPPEPKAKPLSPLHLTLPKAIQLAYKGNNDLRLATLLIQEAKIKKDRSKRKLLPLVKVESTALFWDKKLNMSIEVPNLPIELPPLELRKRWTWITSVTVAQPLTSLLSLKSLYDLEKANVRVTKAKHRIEKRKIREKVEEAYYNVLKADSYLKVIQDAKELLASQEKRVRALIAARVATDTELSKVLSAKAEVEAQEIKVRASGLLARQYLAYLIGLPVDTPLTLTKLRGAASAPRITLPSPAQCHAMAMKQRPEFDYLHRNLLKLEEAKRAINFSRIPQINLIGQYKFSKGTGAMEPENQWFVGILFSWKFDWLNKKREVDRFELKKRSLGVNREKLTRGMALQIHKAHLEMRTAQALVVAHSKAVKAAKENYDKNAKLLQVTYTTNSDLLTARQELTRAQVKLTNARFDYELRRLKYRHSCQ